MTLPLYYDEAALGAEIAPGQLLALSPDTAHHALTVRRARLGEQLLIADGRGALARVVLREDSRVEVLDLEVQQPRRPRLILAQALAKGDRDLQAIEAATEIGVDAVIPFEAQRSIVRWPQAKRERSAAKWEQKLRAAAMQSRRALIPDLEPLCDAAGLARRAADARLVVLHEDAEESLGSMRAADLAASEEIILVVGPEGGIGEQELEVLGASAARRLGPTVLRSSTAGPVALALLESILGRWS